MNLKKKVSLLLAVLLLTATATACGGEDTPSGDGQSESRTAWTSPTTERGDTDEESQTSGTGGEESHETEDETETETEGNTGTATETIPEVYSRYNVQKIGPFENGVAVFYVPQGSGSGYFFGYIDVEGKVLVDAVYKSYGAPLINFAYNYTRVQTTNDDGYKVYRIIDRQGNVIFEERENNVTNIGEISQGYFWVETMEETLAGNIYTMRYYSAKDSSLVVTFEDMKAYEADVYNTGEATLYRRDERGSYYDKVTFNIGDYDTSFVPALGVESKWTVDVENVEEFQAAKYCEYIVSDDIDGAGLVATVRLASKDSVYYYAIVDGTGNVLLNPQREIEFIELQINGSMYRDMYIFYKGLCPARDAASGKWGYIDTQGNWKIQPQYTSVTTFSSDGYATVNDTTVIDTDGNIVLSPSAPKTDLSGKYCWQAGGGIKHYLTFTTDGQINYKIPDYYIDKIGRYQTQDASLKIYDMGFINGGAINGDGSYTFQLNGDKLYINGKEWTLCD